MGPAAAFAPRGTLMVKILIASDIKGLAQQIRPRLDEMEQIGVRGGSSVTFDVAETRGMDRPEDSDSSVLASHGDGVIVADPPILASIVAGGKCTDLRPPFIQSTYAGVDALMGSPLCQMEKPPPLCRALLPSFGQQMSEYVMGYILARERNLFAARDAQKRSQWDKGSVRARRNLSELTLGILGLGHIGKNVAATAHNGFGMRVIGLQRSARTAVEGVSEIVSSLDDLLPQCDYVVNLLPSTDATRGLLSGDVLQMCERSGSKSEVPDGMGCVLINVGRGSICDESSLIRALENRWITGAVLDVFEMEPLPPSSPLWSRENVLISPHTAALSLPSEIAEVFVKNLTRWLEGEELMYKVDWEAGY